MNTHEWAYEDHIPEPRRDRLAAVGSYSTLIASVVADASGIGVRSEPGRAPGLTQCIQPIFSFDLPTTGDPLFNGPFGYRAQFWASPHQGMAANSALIAALTPRLLSCLAEATDDRLTRIDVCSSLTAASAKLWIRESAALANPSRDLRVSPWTHRADEGVELAVLGLMAPEAVKFEVKGALLDAYGHEVVPRSKINRHVQLHHFGFS